MPCNLNAAAVKAAQICLIIKLRKADLLYIYSINAV